MAGLPLLLLCCCCDTLSLSLSPFMKIRTGYFASTVTTSAVITHLPFQMTKYHRTRLSSVRIPEEACFSLFLHKGNNNNGVRLGKEKERERKKKKKVWVETPKLENSFWSPVSVFFRETQVFSVIVIFAAELSNKGGGRGRRAKRAAAAPGRRRKKKEVVSEPQLS